MPSPTFLALEVPTAAAIKDLFCKKSKLAAAASIFAPAFPVAPVGDSAFLVGAFADLSSLMAGPAAAAGLSLPDALGSGSRIHSCACTFRDFS